MDQDSPLNDSCSLLVAKCRRYVERATAASSTSEEHVYWMHHSLEPLIRAAAASVHPVLLADPQSDAALLAAVGRPVDGRPKSRSVSALVTLLARIDPVRFDREFATRTLLILDRRNIEAHDPSPAMATAPTGWRDDLLRLFRPLCTFIGVKEGDVIGSELAAFAAQLAETDTKKVEAAVNRLIAEARSREVKPDGGPAFEEAWFRDGRFVRAWKCPACDLRGALSGWSMLTGPVVLDDGELLRHITVAASSFECGHCDLRLGERALIVAAGLPDSWGTSDPVDAYEALSLDPAEEIERMGMFVVDRDDGD